MSSRGQSIKIDIGKPIDKSTSINIIWINDVDCINQSLKINITTCLASSVINFTCATAEYGHTNLTTQKTSFYLENFVWVFTGERQVPKHLIQKTYQGHVATTVVDGCSLEPHW